MADSVPAAPAAPAAPTTTAPATQAAPAAPVVKTLKLNLPEIGEIDIPEADVIGVVTQFAKMKSSDFAATEKLKEYEAALADDEQLEKFLRQRGKDPAKFSQAVLEKMLKAQVEAETLSPEQKRVKELEAQLAKRDADSAAEKSRRDQEKHDADVASEVKKLDALVNAALKETTLPEAFHSEAAVRRRFGQLLKRNVEIGTDVPPAVLAKLVEAEMIKEHDYVFTKTSPEALYKKLGRKGVEALIKQYAAEITPKTEAAKPRARPAGQTPEDPEALRRRASELQFQRAREDQSLLRGAAQGRTSRYYGSK